MDKKIEKRGRPKILNLEEEKPKIFEKKFNNYDGTYDLWKYNLNINPHGPISVEINLKN